MHARISTSAFLIITLAASVLAACGDGDVDCGMRFIYDETRMRCTCGPGQVELEDGACMFPDGGVEYPPGFDGGAAALDGGSTPDGGQSDSGPPRDDGGSERDAGGDPDAGEMVVDGGGSCDLLTHAGCRATERCVWLQDGSVDGRRACVADDGALALHEACVPPPPGEADGCERGLVCIEGRCERLCSLEAGAEACASGFVCTVIGADETTGFCDPTCDPVRQTRDYDGAAACGSPDPDAPTLGCYGPDAGPFTCDRVLFPERTHRAFATEGSGPILVNACAPGYLPLLTASGPGSDPVCVALCDPAPTWMGSSAERQGTAPHTCPARGATASTEECRFLDAVIGTRTTLEVGLCFDHARYTYDHDRNPATPPVQTPSCATLSMGDADDNGTPDYLEFWCGPLP